LVSSVSFLISANGTEQVMSTIVNATIQGSLRQTSTDPTNPAGPTPDYLATNPFPTFGTGSGYPIPGDTSYVVGSAYGDESRCFLGFDLSALSGTFTSAVLTVVNPQFGTKGVTTQGLTIGDLSADYPALAAGTGGSALWGHWTSATVSATVSSWGPAFAGGLLNGDNSTSIPIPLNSAALIAINAAIGVGQVAFGIFITSVSWSDFHLLFLTSDAEAVPCFLTLS
jgi:hypothetical protein